MPIIRNLRKDFDEGRMDNLRSVDYEESGTQAPYVTKSIGSTSDLASKRVDDLTRMSKLLINKPGLKFLANEALLKQGDLTEKLQGNNGSKVGNIIRRVGGTVKHVAQVALSTLAQVPVNGTGTHFLKAFRTDTYLQDGDAESGFADFFGAGGIEGAQYALRGKAVPSQGLLTKSILPKRNTTPNPGDLGVDHIGIRGTIGIPTDISAYNNETPYYQTTEGTIIGVQNKGIIFANFESGFKVVDNTTAVPYQLGIDKSKTGAALTGGFAVESNPTTLQNKFSPTNSTEFSGLSTTGNIIRAKKGYPINPGGTIETINPATGFPLDLFIPDLPLTTPLSGSFGVSNRNVDFSVSSLEQKTATVFEIGKTKTKFTTPENILAASSTGIITLDKKGKETTSTIFLSQANNFDSGDITGEDGLPVNRYSDDAASLSYNKTLTLDNIRAAQNGNPITSKVISSRPSGIYQGNVSSLGESKTKGALQDFRNPSSKNEYRNKDSDTYFFNYNNTKIKKETRVGLGNPGKVGRVRTSYFANDKDTRDEINSLPVSTTPLDGTTAQDGGNRDLIQLEFQIMTPEKIFYLAFRAFLDTFDDSFNAQWNSTKYLGRADSFYTYGGFERTINIGFKIAAQSREEMQPIYEKAATLASITAPTYGSQGRFMRGSIAKVTVGDYIYEQPGIIESVQYTWQKDYPWEISFQNPELGDKKGDQVLPHVLDVSISFKVIHDFLPETGIVPLITNHNALAKNKKVYIGKEDRAIIPAENEKEKEAREAAEKANEEAAEKASEADKAEEIKVATATAETPYQPSQAQISKRRQYMSDEEYNKLTPQQQRNIDENLKDAPLINPAPMMGAIAPDSSLNTPNSSQITTDPDLIQNQQALERQLKFERMRKEELKQQEKNLKWQRAIKRRKELNFGLSSDDPNFVRGIDFNDPRFN
jgi:hypothetical protein